MPIRPILSALLRNRTGAILVALQVAITLAVVVNALVIILDRTEMMDRDTGIDEAHVLQVASYAYAPGYDWEGGILRDLDTIRGVPGVRAAGTINTLPGSNGGWSSGWRTSPGEETTNFSSAFYAVDAQGLEALGVELVSGRWLRDDEIVPISTAGFEGWFDSVVVTEAYGEAMFPGEDPVGKTLYADGGKNSSTIVGVVRKMAVPWPDYEDWHNSTFIPARYGPPYMRYVVRAQPGESADALLEAVKKAMEDNGEGRVVLSARTHEEILAETFAGDRAAVWSLWAVVGMLIAVTAMGIVGLTSFNVRQRTKQIGTRRALGASRGDILRHFMMENALITAAGVIVGVALTLGLNLWLARSFSLPRLEVSWLPLGMLALFALGQLAVLGPARRASLVPPAVATRTV